MFRKLEVPILGLVENMSWLRTPSGNILHPFGQGGGQSTAQKYELPLLAQLPLDASIQTGGDSGTPAVLNHSHTKPFFEPIVEAVDTLLSSPKKQDV